MIGRGVIWKFPLEVKRRQTLEVPPGAAPLRLDMQHRAPVLWVAVPVSPQGGLPPADSRESWLVRMVGTGWESVPMGGWDYLGTVQEADGDFAWHYFLDGTVGDWKRRPGIGLVGGWLDEMQNVVEGEQR